MSNQRDKYTWFRTASATQWNTARAHRGYTGQIVLASSVYTLTITGTGAPAAAPYPTLKNAKNAFRKFLTAKPVG